MLKTNLKTNSQDQYFEWALSTKIRPIEDEYFFYHFLFNEYVETKVFSLRKQDKSLTKYLKDKGVTSLDNIDEILGQLLTSDSNIEGVKTNILVILDYLSWSYNINIDIDSIDYLKYVIEPQENKIVYMKQYQNSSSLRKLLIEKHGGCQICGVTQNELLIQSHLKPQKDSKKEGKEDEIFDINNLLLLCRHHDGLFDSGLITFDDEGNMIVSKELSEEDVKILGISNGIKIELNEQQKPYMSYHREKVFKQ